MTKVSQAETRQLILSAFVHCGFSIKLRFFKSNNRCVDHRSYKECSLSWVVTPFNLLGAMRFLLFLALLNKVLGLLGKMLVRARSCNKMGQYFWRVFLICQYWLLQFVIYFVGKSRLFMGMWVILSLRYLSRYLLETSPICSSLQPFSIHFPLCHIVSNIREIPTQSTEQTVRYIMFPTEQMATFVM